MDNPQLNDALTEDLASRQIMAAVERTEHFNYLRAKFEPRKPRVETAEELAERIRLAENDPVATAQIHREWEATDARLLCMAT